MRKHRIFLPKTKTTTKVMDFSEGSLDDKPNQGLENRLNALDNELEKILETFDGT